MVNFGISLNFIQGWSFHCAPRTNLNLKSKKARAGAAQAPSDVATETPTLPPETMLLLVCWACGSEGLPSNLAHGLDPQLRQVLERSGFKVEENAKPSGALNETQWNYECCHE